MLQTGQHVAETRAGEGWACLVGVAAQVARGEDWLCLLATGCWWHKRTGRLLQSQPWLAPATRFVHGPSATPTSARCAGPSAPKSRLSSWISGRSVACQHGSRDRQLSMRAEALGCYGLRRVWAACQHKMNTSTMAVQRGVQSGRAAVARLPTCLPRPHGKQGLDASRPAPAWPRMPRAWQPPGGPPPRPRPPSWPVGMARRGMHAELLSPRPRQADVPCVQGPAQAGSREQAGRA